MNQSSNNIPVLCADSLQLLLNATASGLLLVNETGLILFANKAIETLFGYEVSTLIGKHLNVLLLPSTQEKHQQHFSSFFKKPINRAMGESASFPGLHQNGKTVYVGIDFATIAYDSQQCVLATITRATRLNQATELLADSKASLARNINENKHLVNVAKNSLDAVFLLDQEHNITWINTAASLLLNSNSQTLDRICVLEVLNKKTLTYEKNKFELALNQGLSYSGELHIAFDEMLPVQVYCSLQPVFDNEMLQGFTLSARDITNTRLLEAQMRDNNELLETIARIASLGYYSLDIQKNELTWSEQVYKIHDLPLHTKVEVSQALDFYAPQARAKISAAVERCMTTGKAFDMELPFITATKRKIWVRSVGYAEFVDGQPIKLKGAFQDISHMRQAALDAEQAADAKSNFLTNMSHELRTPISGILGISEVLSETRLNNKQQEYLSMVQSSGRSLLFLVNQVLDYAKLNAGSQKLRDSIINLPTFIQHKTYIHALAASEKGCQFTLDISPELPQRYLGDADRIGQIINNLCSNAVKFTRQGEIRIAVGINQQKMLKFEICDSGVGISKKDMNSLFTEFQQLDSTFSRDHQGTGLGLTITKQLVELMSGEIGVSSVLGEGSTFWFTLPINERFSDAAIEAKAVLMPNTLVLAASDERCEQWRLLAKREKIKIKAVSSISALIAALKLDVHWALSVITSLPEGMPLKTCIGSICRVADSGHKVLVDEALLGVEERPLANVHTLNLRPDIASVDTQEYLQEQFRVLQNWYSQFSHINNEDWANKHVLIVEDNKINQALFIGLLSSTAIKISIANHGKEALAIIEHDESIDLVIMDCQMPVMDGFEATKHIRKHKNNRISRLRISAATAHGFEEDIQACFDVGMNDVLVKPFTKQQLIDTISRNL